MTTSIKITALNPIGANIAYTTLLPVVNMAGTPTTEKATAQVLGNLILNGAGGSYFPAAAQSLLSQTVSNASQPNITSVGTLTSLTVSGNSTLGNIAGGNLISATYLSGTLTTAAQPNVTSLGTLVSASVTGNISAGNLNANTGRVTASLLTGTLTTNAQPNITSVGNLYVLDVTTNITAAGNVSCGNLYANASDVVATRLTGSLMTNAQPNITSVGTLTSLAVSGNVTISGNLTSLNSVVWVSAPSANTDTGTAGQAAYDTGGNLFVCVSTNTWAKFTGTTSW